jgi:hypothetical protein
MINDKGEDKLLREGYFPKEKMGQITLSGKLRITDPCYEPDTWCAGLLNVKPGQYDCYQYKHNHIWEPFREGDKYSNDTRVGAIEIRHKSANKPVFNQRLDNSIGVDSGQAGFFDQAYYDEMKTGDEETWYDRVCGVTYNPKDERRAGTIDNKGFVSSSGYGDGGYDCFVSKNAEGEIDALLLVYILPKVADRRAMPEEFVDILPLIKDYLDENEQAMLDNTHISGSALEQLRNDFPEGARVRLVEMKDVYAPPAGTLGTVRSVDNTGTIHVSWDNGSSLGLMYGADTCERVDRGIEPKSHTKTNTREGFNER